MDTPNPKKRQRRRDARPAEIIAAGRRLFVTQGYAATRMEEVARAAGVAKGTVYLYFPTKQALFEAVARTAMLAGVEAGRAALFADPDVPAADLLRRYIGNGMRFLAATDGFEIVRLVIAELPAFPDLAAFYYREVVTPDLETIRRIIAHGVARGEFAAGRADLPELISMPLLMAGVWRLTFRDVVPVDLEAMADALAASLLDGLRARD